MSRPAAHAVSRRKAPRRAQADRREEAKAAILDAAERGFAQHGRDGMTVRLVAAGAKVDPALVHYYFGDLEGVYREVILRKARVLNEIRMEALEGYIGAHAGKLTIEGALEAFARPVYERLAHEPKYWSDYAAILAHTSTQHFAARDYIREAFDHTVHPFIDLLARIGPEIPRAEIYWYFHLWSGAFTLGLVRPGRIDKLSGGLVKSTDPLAVLAPMVALYAAGFEALRVRYRKKK